MTGNELYEQLYSQFDRGQMEVLQYCVQTRTEIQKIKDGCFDIKYKINLMQSLRRRLKQMDDGKVNRLVDRAEKEKEKDDLSTTFFSEIKSIFCKQEQQQLIDKILKKQKQKIQLDEQIQTYEDDLGEITKVIETKQAFNEELGIKIIMRKKKIEEEKQQQKVKQEKIKKVKSSPNIFKIIFGN